MSPTRITILGSYRTPLSEFVEINPGLDEVGRRTVRTVFTWWLPTIRLVTGAAVAVEGPVRETSQSGYTIVRFSRRCTAFRDPDAIERVFAHDDRPPTPSFGMQQTRLENRLGKTLSDLEHRLWQKQTSSPLRMRRNTSSPWRRNSLGEQHRRWHQSGPARPIGCRTKWTSTTK
eukprot:1191246-Amphidinium_carterae.1